LKFVERNNSWKFPIFGQLFPIWFWFDFWHTSLRRIFSTKEKKRGRKRKPPVGNLLVKREYDRSVIFSLVKRPKKVEKAYWEILKYPRREVHRLHTRGPCCQSRRKEKCNFPLVPCYLCGVLQKKKKKKKVKLQNYQTCEAKTERRKPRLRAKCNFPLAPCYLCGVLQKKK
jgi:hypothetical protein